MVKKKHTGDGQSIDELLGGASKGREITTADERVTVFYSPSGEFRISEDGHPLHDVGSIKTVKEILEARKVNTSQGWFVNRQE